MTQYDSPSIQTANRELEVGKTYQYKEDGYFADVELLGVEERDNWLSLQLKIKRATRWPSDAVGQVFTVGVTTDRNLACNGSWKLYELGTYG